MINQIRRMLSIFRDNRLLTRNFLILFILLSLAFSLFSITINSSSKATLESEIFNTNEQRLTDITTSFEKTIKEMRFLLASIEISDHFRTLFISDDPSIFYENYDAILQNSLLSLSQSQRAIEALYIYKTDDNRLYDKNGVTQIKDARDVGWLEYPPDENDKYTIFPYAMSDSYPFVICIRKEVEIGGKTGAFAVMLNIGKLPEFSNIQQSATNRIFLISDKDEIIYRRLQRNLYEPLASESILSNYRSGVSTASSTINYQGTPYIFLQQKSSQYPWSYVLASDASELERNLSNQTFLFISLLFSLIVVALVFSVFFSLRTFQPVITLKNILEHPELFNGSTPLPNADSDFIARQIVHYIQTNDSLRKQLEERLHLLNQQQILTLQSQINPHFLYNTLNLIHSQAVIDMGYDHEFPRLIHNTTSILRYSLSPENLVLFDEELAYAKKYLNILQLRFGKNLTFIEDIDDATYDAVVPRLFVQPIIENMVYHAFADRYDEQCVVKIRTYLSKGGAEDLVYPTDFVIELYDNGVGMSQETIDALYRSLKEPIESDKKIGLRNVVQRMKLIYADQCKMTISSELGKGSCFTIRFPYITE